MIKVLVTGLPGSGKTYFSEMVRRKDPSRIKIFNGDLVRATFCDWGFSHEDRTRQAIRMSEMWIPSHVDMVLYDFVCPRNVFRDIVNADVVVFVDTITISKYADTNVIWEEPTNYRYRITEFQQFQTFVDSLFSEYMPFY